MNLSILKINIKKFPKNPGVYMFLSESREVLYIGKATNLKNRVSSYFSLTPSPSPRGRGGQLRPIEQMLDKVFYVKFRETDTVLEALILEANLIKKHQPKYNVMGKDDKSYAYFLITKEDFPKILILRKTDFDNSKYRSSIYAKGKAYGPYASKKQMQIALKIIRRIFPFHNRTEKSEKGCLEYQIGLCPGPYDGAITKADYKKNIHGIRMILEGKKKSLVKKLEREMKEYSKKENFEKAADLRNKIFALNHIQDIALISEENSKLRATSYELRDLRIEAYDISNISGDFAVGSMVVFDNSRGEFEPDKDEYRKFKIRTIKGSDDVGMMREVLKRRFKNNWKLPDIIILDGGKGHVNMAEKVLSDSGLNIPIVGVAKGPKRKNLELSISNLELGMEKKNILKNKKILKQITDEAHRFAIRYHRKLREKI